MSTDKARETIAEIVTSFIPKFIISSAQPHDAADAILAALPEIIRQNPSIIADMVEPLDFEMVETANGFDPNSCFEAENDFGQTYVVRGNWLWLPDPYGEGAEPEPHADPFKFADNHNRVAHLKALGMKEGE